MFYIHVISHAIKISYWKLPHGGGGSTYKWVPVGSEGLRSGSDTWSLWDLCLSTGACSSNGPCLPPLLALHPDLSLMSSRRASPREWHPRRWHFTFQWSMFKYVKGLKLEPAYSRVFSVEMRLVTMMSIHCPLDVKSECVLGFSQTHFSFQWLVLPRVGILSRGDWIGESGMEKGPSSTHHSMLLRTRKHLAWVDVFCPEVNLISSWILNPRCLFCLPAKLAGTSGIVKVYLARCLVTGSGTPGTCVVVSVAICKFVNTAEHAVLFTSWHEDQLGEVGEGRGLERRAKRFQSVSHLRMSEWGPRASASRQHFREGSVDRKRKVFSSTQSSLDFLHMQGQWFLES